MELKKMYLETKKDSDIYTIYLKSYDHVFAIKTNDYSEEIAELLDWAYSSYQIMSVVKNGEVMKNSEYLYTPKSELLEDLQFKVEAYCFEEPDEVIEGNIERIKQLLIDESQ
jgi:D-alanyl-D-alanine carboxypeptidase